MTGQGGAAMRPFHKTIPLDDAIALVIGAARPIERTVRAPLEEAAGRVLAADVVAGADVPPFDRAAMDGFAVIAEDTSGAARESPRTLRRIETVHTGSIPTRRVGRGECVQIATGAPLPAGADAVVMVERTDGGAHGAVGVQAPVRPGQHVGRRAADLAAGDVAVPRGDVLTPSRLGAIAALGVAEVEVFDRPAAAILSTGDEIVAPGRPLGPGQIYDVNRFTVGAVIAAHGGRPLPRAAAADTLDALEAAVDACRDADVLVFSGGSSVGERDLMADLLTRRGDVLFHGVAVKPGKPTAFGRIDGTPVFGMPGYPASCLSNAYLLLVPLLRRMARLPPWRPRTVAVPLARRVASTAGRRQFYTVRVVDGEAVPAFKASGDITSMSRADGYIDIPDRTEAVEQGAVVEVTLF